MVLSDALKDAFSAGPLEDVKVVEMGHILAGPFCGQLMADFGADVVKLEPPGVGDPMRVWGGEKGSQGQSPWWPVVARGKRSVTLNLRSAEGQELARNLLADADVLVENFRPGTLERWNLDPDHLRDAHPGLIVVRVTGFGQSGPYAARPGYGSVGEAMGGLRNLSGEPDAQPSRIGISIGDALAGMFAMFGALMALRVRDRTGEGQVVDAAIYEAVLALMESLLTEYQISGHIRERTGSLLPGVAPSNVYPTRDGFLLLIAANQDTVFRRLAAAMEQSHLADDQRFADHLSRGANQHELDGIIATWSSQRDADAIEKALEDVGVPFGRIYRAPDILADPHVEARDALVDVDTQHFGPVKMQNVVPKLSATPGAVRWGGPKLGAHTDEVLHERLGISTSAIADFRERGII